MYNRLECIGYLTKDIELKYLQSGASVAKCAIATSHKYKEKEETMFIDFDVFGKGAEIINQYCKKGSKIFIDGRLVLEQWTANDGSKKNRHKLLVNEFKFLDCKNDDHMQQQHQQTYQEPTQPQQQCNRNDHVQEVPNIEVDEDEIPF